MRTNPRGCLLHADFMHGAHAHAGVLRARSRPPRRRDTDVTQHACSTLRLTLLRSADQAKQVMNDSQLAVSRSFTARFDHSEHHLDYEPEHE